MVIPDGPGADPLFADLMLLAKRSKSRSKRDSGIAFAKSAGRITWKRWPTLLVCQLSQCASVPGATRALSSA